VRSRHRRKLREPLVPIHGERLATALQLGAWTVRGAAAALRRHGVPVVWQTLQLVLAGRQARVRRPLLEGLVVLLRGPFSARPFRAWLRGEGADPGESLAAPDQALSLRRLAAARDVPGLLAPLAYLAARRDAERFRARALEEQPSRARDFRWHEVNVGGWVQTVYNPVHWRRVLLRPADSPSEDEVDAAAEHLAGFLGIVLAPWLKGRARLRPDARKQLQSFLGKLGELPP